MKTIMVKRANVVLDVSPEEKDYYLGQGYDVIDERGEVVEGTTSMTLEAVIRRNKELTEMLAEKDAIISDRDAEIAKLKKAQKSKGKE